MNTEATLLQKRQERILKAMKGEKTDRTPLMFAGDYALIRYLEPSTTFQYMIEDHEELTRRVVKDFLPLFPKIDMIAAVGMSSRFLGAPHMAKTYLPGKELDPDIMWQPVFEHILEEEDYDYIIDHGWKEFNGICMFERLGYDPDEMMADLEAGIKNKWRYHDAGLPFALGNLLPAPFDTLAFGRGLMDFFVDLDEYPEKIIEVFTIIMDEYEAENKEAMIREVSDAKARGEEMMYTITPAVQANCNLVSKDMFERFAWPLYERQANFILDNGGYVFFHMDTSWTDFLDFFTCFPKGRCLFDTDGGTDMVKAKKILGPTMAITGSISSSTLAFGSPETVYSACRDQIEMMGDGFILAPSCTLPANMPKENIDAMYAAIA